MPGLFGVFLALDDEEGTDRQTITDALVAAVHRTDAVRRTMTA